MNLSSACATNSYLYANVLFITETMNSCLLCHSGFESFEKGYRRQSLDSKLPKLQITVREGIETVFPQIPCRNNTFICLSCSLTVGQIVIMQTEVNKLTQVLRQKWRFSPQQAGSSTTTATGHVGWKKKAVRLLQSSRYGALYHHLYSNSPTAQSAFHKFTLQITRKEMLSTPKRAEEDMSSAISSVAKFSWSGFIDHLKQSLSTLVSACKGAFLPRRKRRYYM